MAMDYRYRVRLLSALKRGDFIHGSIRRKLEEKITEGDDPDNSDLCYYYAKYVIQGPFPLGEPLIATNPERACWYAISILKRRWPEGERAIAEFEGTAVDYFFRILEPGNDYTSWVLRDKVHEWRRKVLNG